jgi:hypothetical protein
MGARCSPTTYSVGLDGVVCFTWFARIRIDQSSTRGRGAVPLPRRHLDLDLYCTGLPGIDTSCLYQNSAMRLGHLRSPLVARARAHSTPRDYLACSFPSPRLSQRRNRTHLDPICAHDQNDSSQRWQRPTCHRVCLPACRAESEVMRAHPAASATSHAARSASFVASPKKTAGARLRSTVM